MYSFCPGLDSLYNCRNIDGSHLYVSGLIRRNDLLALKLNLSQNNILYYTFAIADGTACKTLNESWSNIDIWDLCAL